MRSIQNSLPISIELPPATRQEAIERNRRALMNGRPRRLKSMIDGASAEAQNELLAIYAMKHASVKDLRKALASFTDKWLQDSRVIKVSIHRDKSQVIKRIAKRLDATRPEVVRTAVEKFVSSNKEKLGNDPATNVQRVPVKGRCEYLKVPFDPETLRIIGNSDSVKRKTVANGLCRVYGMTRQQLINLALDEYIQESRG